LYGYEKLKHLKNKMEVIILFRQLCIFQQMNDDEEALANSILNKALGKLHIKQSTQQEGKEGNEEREDTQVQAKRAKSKVHHKVSPRQSSNAKYVTLEIKIG